MIKKNEYIIASFYLTRLLIIGNGFNMLIKSGQNDCILASILGFLLGYFLLYISFKKKNLNNSLINLISISSIIISILAGCILIDNYLLFKTPSYIIILTFFILFLYGSSKNIKHIGITTTSFLLFSSITIPLMIIWLIILIKPSNYLPLFITHIFKLIKTILIFSTLTLTPNLILLKLKGNLKFKDVAKGYIYGSLYIIIMLIFIIGVYGYKLSTIIRFPEYSILKKIYFFNKISNIENILILEWITTISISCIYCFKTLKMNLKKKYFYFLILIIFIIICYFSSNKFSYIMTIKNANPYLFLGLTLLTIIT